MGKADQRLLIALLGGDAEARRTAGKLLAHWPTLPDLVAASSESVRAVGGSRAAAICSAVAGTLHRITSQSIEDRPLISSSRELQAYLRLSMAYKPGEEMRVLYLNAGLRLIRDETTGAGTADRLVFEPKAVLRRAIELQSCGIILAHNHPGGSGQPSPNDVAATRRLAQLAALIDIRLHDHLIVTRCGLTSLRETGHL